MKYLKCEVKTEIKLCEVYNKENITNFILRNTKFKINYNFKNAENKDSIAMRNLAIRQID